MILITFNGILFAAATGPKVSDSYAWSSHRNSRHGARKAWRSVRMEQHRVNNLDTDLTLTDTPVIPSTTQYEEVNQSSRSSILDTIYGHIGRPKPTMEYAKKWQIDMAGRDTFTPPTGPFPEANDLYDCELYDTDVAGVDLLKKWNVHDWKQCQEHCQEYKPCGYFTYIKEWEGCFLKGPGNNTVNRPGAVSGPRRCREDTGTTKWCTKKGHNLYGNDMGAVSGATNKECERKCDDTDRCTSYTRYRSTCYLKRTPIDEPNWVANNAVTSGIKCNPIEEHVAECKGGRKDTAYNGAYTGAAVSNDISICQETCAVSGRCGCISYHKESGVCIHHKNSVCRFPSNHKDWESGKGCTGATPTEEDPVRHKEKSKSVHKDGPNSIHARSDVTSYGLVADYRGRDFGCGGEFNFETFDDPTKGYVNYLSCNEAQRRGLVEVQGADRVIYRTDSRRRATGRGRDSIRVSSKESWDDGLFIWNIRHMPTGCGNWPALWTVGPNWPNGGEIDVLEGSNIQTMNNVALHTSDNCTMADKVIDSSSTWLKTYGESRLVDAVDCHAYATRSNYGCAQKTSQVSFGEPLNAMGGGYFVMELNSEAISVWFFTNDDVPADIVVGNPNPDAWRTKDAHFPMGDNCDASRRFYSQRIVINNTLCGGYAGGKWGVDKCPRNNAGSGIAQCEAYVRDNPSAFKDAFWDIRYVRVFQKFKGSKGVSELHGIEKE